MATLASLNLVLSATSAAFVSQMSKAKRSVTDLQSGVVSLSRAMLGWGSVITTVAAGAGMAAFLKNSFETIDANAKLSDRLGITTEALAGLQHAGKLAGTESEALTAGLEKMLRVLGDARNGSATAAGAFAAIGINVASLDNAAPDEVFRRIADGLKNIHDPAARAAAAVGIFGKAGQGLLPLMLSGADGIKAAQAEAAKLGITFSRIDAAKVEAANDSMTRLGQVFVGVANTLAIELSPYITALATGLVELATSGEGMGAKVSSAFQYVAESIATTADYLQLLPAGFHAFKAAALEAIASVTDAAEWLDDKLSKLFNIAPEIDKAAHAQAASLHAAAGAEYNAMKKAMDAFHNGDNATAASRFFAKIRNNAQKSAKDAADAAKRLNSNPFDWGLGKLRALMPEIEKAAKTFGEKFQEAAEKNWEKLKDDAQGVVDSTRTPLEQLQKERERLDRLHRLGLLDDTTFGRAMTDAAAKAKDALGLGGQAKGVEAMERRSGFTFSAPREMADPLKSIADTSKGTEAAAKTQAKLLTELMQRVRRGETISLDDALGQATGG